MYLIIVFFTLVSFFSSHAMIQPVSSWAPSIPMLPYATTCAAPRYEACTGMVFQYPTLHDVKHSYLGRAIEEGDIVPISRTFDKQTGLRGFLRWLLLDDRFEHVRAAHCLIYAVNFPSRSTGPIVNYLWHKIKSQCNKASKFALGASASLVSKGTCLILNAYQNGHEVLFEDLIKMPIMDYGVCESLRHAVNADDMDLLRALIDAGAKCNSDLLIHAIMQEKTHMASILLAHKIGVHWCDDEHGSALHMAIFKKSPLVKQLIAQLPKYMIHCHTNFKYVDIPNVQRVVEFSALDMLFRQPGYGNEVVRALLERGAECGPGASQDARRLAADFRRKFGIPTEEVCENGEDGKFIICLDTVKFGW